MKIFISFVLLALCFNACISQKKGILEMKKSKYLVMSEDHKNQTRKYEYPISGISRISKESPFGKTAVEIHTSDNSKVRSLLQDLDKYSSSEFLNKLKGIKGQISFDVFYLDWTKKNSKEEIGNLLKMLDDTTTCPALAHTNIYGRSTLVQIKEFRSSKIGMEALFLIHLTLRGDHGLEHESEYLDTIIKWYHSKKSIEDFKPMWKNYLSQMKK